MRFVAIFTGKAKFRNENSIPIICFCFCWIIKAYFWKEEGLGGWMKFVSGVCIIINIYILLQLILFGSCCPQPITGWILTKRWLLMHLASSMTFIYLGLIGVHHNPNVWHAGDKSADPDSIVSKHLDYGIFQLIAVGQIANLDQSDLITLIRYGRHALHHMFPTVDHVRLPELEKVFVDTCREFKILDLAAVDDVGEPKSAWAKSRNLTIAESAWGLIMQVSIQFWLLSCFN
jgi:hypothetical protein